VSHGQRNRNNVDTVRKDTESLIDASKEVGLEINVDNAKYMLLLVTRM
jgi:hypothetical protein